MKENLDEIQKRYKLSNEEHVKIEKYIKQIILSQKSPVKRPKAIFTVAPPGSGKTGLNGYCVKQFDNDNLVVVNNDELKPFHPKADEIAKLYPKYYTKVTNEASKFWTDSLLYEALEKKYNVLYEGTGRRIDLFEKMISKMDGYEIIIRAMAVSDINCLISILERYEYQVKEKGWGRLISVDTFYKAYNDEMLNTIDTLEKSGKINTVEVYSRGNTPSQPIKIYSSDTREFPSAKYAVINGRLQDTKQAIEYFETHNNQMNKLLANKELSKEEKDILEKVQELYDELNNTILENKETDER